MKRILIAVAAAASLSACGAISTLKAAANGDQLSADKVSATGYTLAKNLQDIQSLSGGLNGLVPSLDTQGSGAGLAPALRLAPSLAPQPTQLDCSLVPNVPTEFAYTATNTTFAPAAEEAKTVTTIHIWCAAATVTGGTIFAANVETTYKDASTATASLKVLDGDKDLVHGLSQLDMTRTFADTDKRKSFSLEIKVDFLGTWEDPNAVSYGKFDIVMRNGTEVMAEITPDAPLMTGDEFTKGTATRTTIYGEGNLTKTTETATVTAKDIGTYHVVNEYKDGTKDDVTVTADGNVLTLAATGHDGFTRSGSLQLASGAYSLVTSFPQGSPIKTLTESGTWHKNATNGTYSRTINWADDHTSQTNASVNINGDTLSATFTHDDNVSDSETSQISGKLDITKSDTQTSIGLEVSNAAGDNATLKGVKYADGSATLHYTKDLKSTAVNPDEEGDLTFNADGSGTGTITVHEGGVTKTVSVTVSAEGSVK